MSSPSSKDSENPHAHLYKYKEKKQSTHARRIQFLEEQKEKRSKNADQNRHVYDTFLKEINEPLEGNSLDEAEGLDMEIEIPKRRSRRFELMMTEWFSEIPDDLDENWLVKFCPEGSRVLVFCSKRSTNVYNWRGMFLFKTQTNFHGGGNIHARGTTVLDCIYNKYIKTFFILDCLFWNSMLTLGNEATFRFYWLYSQFQQMPELTNPSYSKFKFILMDAFPAIRALIQDKIFDVLKVEDKEVFYDGVVFYHKESEYTFGDTPLATWLHFFMLPEKLGIDIPEVYKNRTPEGYVNMKHFIENRETFRKQKREKIKNNESMETQ